MVYVLKTVQGTQLEIDGEIIAIITRETDPNAVKRFIYLCNENEAELGGILAECATRRQWNHDHPGQGKNWPVFTTKERVVTRLLKQAGIKDS